MHRAAFFVLVIAVAAGAAVVALAATQSPRKLRTEIFNTARKQRSVHYEEHAVGPGLTQTMASDVARKRGVQRISFTLGKKKGRFTARVVNKTAYLRGDTEALHGYFGFTAAQAARYAGRWIAVRRGQPKYNDLAASVTLPSFLHDIYPGTPLVNAAGGGGTNGVMIALVKVLISVLKASAIERPTATTTRLPCMRKFLKPWKTDMATPFPTTMRGRYERVASREPS